jgi:hypothetical protein
VTLHDLHEVNAYVLIGLNALAGVVCLAAYRWSARWSVRWGRATWTLVIVAQLTTFVQATLGTVLFRRSGAEQSDMHALYGFSAIIAVAIMYSYRTSPFMKGKQLLLYGLGSLFVMGLGLRNLVL